MHSSLALHFALLAATSAPAAAQQLLQTYTGSVGDEFGAALLQTADQNNDGYVDLLVGAPGWNSSRGYIRCLSGRFMATGAGSAVLWTLYSTANAGARFGSSIVAVATLTGDNAADYVVGAPGYTVSGSPRGALMLVDGATHVVADYLYGLSNTRLGESIAAIGDQDGDGKIDIAATSPSTAGAASYVRLISGSAFASPFNSLLQVPHTSINSNGSTFYGEELASGFDLDGDGRFDLAIGSPRMLTNGFLEVLRPDSTLAVLGTYTGAFAGERMGSSIDARHDYNGDGVVDLVVGAPNSPNGSAFEVGRAVVLSGARLLAHTAPFEMYSMSFGSVTPPVNHSDPAPNFHFGAEVRSSADLNNDGVGEFIVGAPGYFTQSFLSGWSFRGAVRVYSGATGVQLIGFTGASTDRLGDALLGGFLDLNADGFPEFAVAGSLSDNSTTDCGTLSLFQSDPDLQGARHRSAPVSARRDVAPGRGRRSQAPHAARVADALQRASARMPQLRARADLGAARRARVAVRRRSKAGRASACGRRVTLTNEPIVLQ